MKKLFFLFIAYLLIQSASAQVPVDTLDARTKLNTWIVPNGNKTITATKVNQLLNGILNLMKAYAVDSGYIPTNSDTLILVRKGFPPIKIKLPVGSGGVGSEIDPSVPSIVKSLTTADITRWNAKQNALSTGSGVYIDNGILQARKDSSLWNASKIQGKAVSSSDPFNGQVLKWNGTTWAPANDSVGTGGGGVADGNNYPYQLSFDTTTGVLSLLVQGKPTLTENKLDNRYTKKTDSATIYVDTTLIGSGLNPGDPLRINPSVIDSATIYTDTTLVGIGTLPNPLRVNPNILSGAGIGNYEPLITAGSASDYFRGDKVMAPLNKAAVGLGLVDNTSDLDKPISTATQAALDTKIGESSDNIFSGNNVFTQSVLFGDAGNTPLAPLHIKRDVVTDAGIVILEGSDPDMIFNATGPANWTTFTFKKLGVPKWVFGTNNTSDFYYSRFDGAYHDNTFNLNYNTGQLTLGNLAGTGVRMVVANEAGALSTQEIPVGGDGGITSESDPVYLAAESNLMKLNGSYANPSSITSLDWNKIINAPAIPTNNSQLTNGAGYLTTYTETDPVFGAESSNIPKLNGTIAANTFINGITLPQAKFKLSGYTASSSFSVDNTGTFYVGSDNGIYFFNTGSLYSFAQFNGKTSIGAGSTVPTNILGVGGGTAIGATVANTITAPINGLLVEGALKFQSLAGTGNRLLAADASGNITASIADNSANWTAGYNDKVNSVTVTGTTEKTIILHQQDGGTATGTFTDLTAPYTDFHCVTNGSAINSTLGVISIPTNETGVYELTFAGDNNTTDESMIVGKLIINYTNPNGIPAFTGDNTVIGSGAMAGLQVIPISSSGQIEIQVKGVTGQNINWTARVVQTVVHETVL